MWDVGWGVYGFLCERVNSLMRSASRRRHAAGAAVQRTAKALKQLEPSRVELPPGSPGATPRQLIASHPTRGKEFFRGTD